MSGRPPCNACGYPFRGNWIPLPPRGASGRQAVSYLCPRCAMGQGGASLARGCSLRSQYRNARRCGGLGGPETQQRRVEQLTSYLRKRQAKLTLVVLGAGQQGLCQKLGGAAKVLSLDPDADPQNRSSAIPESLETWSLKHAGTVDLVVDTHLLDHLHDPRAHLKAIARCLRSDATARIEVDNLCNWASATQRKPAPSRRAQLFSPHSLATMCSHAGLAPIEIEIAKSVVMVCRKARAKERARIFAGPSASCIASRLSRPEPQRTTMPPVLDRFEPSTARS